MNNAQRFYDEMSELLRQRKFEEAKVPAAKLQDELVKGAEVANPQIRFKDPFLQVLYLKGFCKSVLDETIEQLIEKHQTG